MANYSFQQLRREVEKRPSLLQEIISFVKYIASPSCQRLAKGKSQQEFAEVIALLLDNVRIPSTMAKFIAQSLFYYLKEQKISFLNKQIQDIQNQANTYKSLALLQALLNTKTEDSTTKNKPAFIVSSPSLREKVETFISSGPIIKSLAKPFKEETFMASPRGRKKTILGLMSPLQDEEVENLRVETLVSVKHKAATVKWKSVAQEKQLLSSRPNDFIKILKSIAGSGIASDQRQMVNNIKNSILVRRKLLLQEQIIINIINHGVKSFYHTLNRLSKLTNNSRINKQVWNYLHHLAEENLQNHATEFRRQLEICEDVSALDSLLSKYTLASSSTIKKYSALKIIKNVKHIRIKYGQSPHKLNSIMNKYLGAYGEANIRSKLSQILVNNAADIEILAKIQRTKKLEQALKILQRLKGYANLKPISEKLLEVIELFIQEDNRATITQLKASLNFVTSSLTNKLVSLVQYKLNQELLYSVNQVLQSKKPTLERLGQLQTFLKNSRYQDHEINIFSCSTSVLEEKILAFKRGDANLERMVLHIFPGSQFPEKFRQLVLKARREEIYSGQKNLDNFRKALDTIIEKIRKREPIQIRSELINLFKSYGTINFADESASTMINGYAIAQHIQRYYSKPNRTTIDLPQEITSDILSKVKNIIDDERDKQLKKLLP